MEAAFRRLLLRRRKSKSRIQRDYSNPDLVEKMNKSIHRHGNMMMSCYDVDAVQQQPGDGSMHPSQMIVRTDAKHLETMSALGSYASLGGEYSCEDEGHKMAVLRSGGGGKLKGGKGEMKKRKERKRGDAVFVDALDDRMDNQGGADGKSTSNSEKNDDGIIVPPPVSLPNTAKSSDPDPLTDIVLTPTGSDIWDMEDDGNGNDDINNSDSNNISDTSGDLSYDISDITSKAVACKVSKPSGPRRALSGGTVAKDESKLKKIAIRVTSGCSMVSFLLFIMNRGHIYICAVIFLVQVLLFRELVKVRYNTFFYIIEETIPLFRTTQWLWFVTSIFYTCSDFIVEVIKSNTSLHHLLNYAQLFPGFAFLLYSGTFVITIVSMQKDHIRFQLNQLCWTILVLCLTVGQLKYIMHNVYNGLIWFALPMMLVIFNDSYAWLAGITCGRKFIHREFLRLSPNKTWEGFIGGWIGTMISGWYLSGLLAQYTWMTCPINDFNLFPGPLECEPNPIFHKATNNVPPQIFELFPRNLVRMIPGIVNVCMVGGDPNMLAACVSGDDGMQHDHFEMVLRDFYPVQIHALGLSLFASFVAPFGGFLASAIKRAYAIKDFASLIPGHGGMMDRMDCQLLMALCTWVHYNTFVSMATVSVPKMLYMYNLLNESEQGEFLKRIAELSDGGDANLLGAP